MTLMWNDRLSWSGEIPASLGQLGVVALTRANPSFLGGYSDAVSWSRTWEYVTSGSGSGNTPGLYGESFLINTVNPSDQKERITLPYFSGLWPSSGRILIGGWFKNFFTMSFVPLISTRGGSSPVVYLSSATSQRPRAQVYGPSDNLVLDEYETVPWQASGGWIWYGMYVDMDNQTCQLGSVEYATGDTFFGPVYSLTGPVNPASTADVDVYGLQNSNYWSSGWADEIVIAQPSDTFSFTDFVESVGRGTFADGQTTANMSDFDVNDARIEANRSTTLTTGHEVVSWPRQPSTDAPSGSTAHLSDDGGASWSSYTRASLPSSFTGLMYWTVPLGTGESFSGIDLTVPSLPPPTMAPITDVTMEQESTTSVPLTYTVSGEGTWTIDAGDTATVTRSGDNLFITSSFATGVDLVTVALEDADGQTASRTFTVTVTAADSHLRPTPEYPKAPIILWNETEPWDILPDPLTGVITKEVDGEDTLEFSFWADEPRANVIKNERRVTCAGETYKIRRITDTHSGGNIVREVYCEALFYDLATAGQIDARTWTQVTAGEVMQRALRGTGWAVAVANVTTLRTYDTEDMNPLQLLREVKKNHGGELIFDNENKQVSLLTSAGENNGVAFFYGFNLIKSQRLVDTTSLVTRLYAKNADGDTIAPVNGGLPYLEDFSYTDEIKIAVYDFKSGTSAYTMLSMARATLANRSQPDYSYEVEVSDLSYESGQTIDRFDLRDKVRVVDEAIGINEIQDIVQMEYDVISPWNSLITLSGKLREGGGSGATDAGVLTTGSTRSTFDLVPYNLFLNGRFDQGLAHWARFGAVVEQNGQGTGDYSAVFTGSGESWIEQTVQVDNRDGFTLSLDVANSGGPVGWSPDLTAVATVVYEDGSTEEIPLELS